MNRRTFIHSVSAILGVLGFSRTGEAKADLPEYPAEWLDWYRRDGKWEPVDHSCGAEYQPGELVRMNDLPGEEPQLYRVPLRPAPNTQFTEYVRVGNGVKRVKLMYLGTISSL